MPGGIFGTRPLSVVPCKAETLGSVTHTHTARRPARQSTCLRLSGRWVPEGGSSALWEGVNGAGGSSPPLLRLPWMPSVPKVRPGVGKRRKGSNVNPDYVFGKHQAYPLWEMLTLLRGLCHV